MTRVTGITEITRMTGMIMARITRIAGMTGITRMTGMTRSQGLYPFLNKKIQRLLRTDFSFFKDSNHSLEYTSFLVLPQHDCNFNIFILFKVFLCLFPFRHLRIWVGKSQH